jgi:hypothetical protein
MAEYRVRIEKNEQSIGFMASPFTRVSNRVGCAQVLIPSLIGDIDPLKKYHIGSIKKFIVNRIVSSITLSLRLLYRLGVESHFIIAKEQK